MDPVTIGILMALGGIGGAAAIHEIVRRMRGTGILPDGANETDAMPIPEVLPTTETEEQRRAREEERRRLEEEERQRALQEERSAEEARKEAERRMAAILERVTASIAFTSRRVPVGMAKVGDRAVGMVCRESPVPANETRIRRIRDLTEIPLLLPVEYLEEDNGRWLERLVTGDALVRVHVRHEQILEPIFEMQFEERVRAFYLLLDVSPSMYDNTGAWRFPVWQSIVQSLVDRARAVQAPIFLRVFASNVRDLRRVLTPEEAIACKRYLRKVEKGNGTNIALAIRTAIRDFEKETYDTADICIVTDGEDNQGLDVEAIRATLGTARIRLHSTLLGANNEALRACSDSHILIEKDLSVRSMGTRN